MEGSWYLSNWAYFILFEVFDDSRGVLWTEAPMAKLPFFSWTHRVDFFCSCSENCMSTSTGYFNNSLVWWDSDQLYGLRVCSISYLSVFEVKFLQNSFSFHFVTFSMCLSFPFKIDFVFVHTEWLNCSLPSYLNNVIKRTILLIQAPDIHFWCVCSNCKCLTNFHVLQRSVVV